MADDAHRRRPWFRQHLTQRQYDALTASVRATVLAEPGRWSIAALARDYEVSEKRMRTVVGRLGGEVERRGHTSAARLWPRGGA